VTWQPPPLDQNPAAGRDPPSIVEACGSRSPRSLAAFARRLHPPPSSATSRPPPLLGGVILAHLVAFGTMPTPGVRRRFVSGFSDACILCARPGNYEPQAPPKRNRRRPRNASGLL